MKSFKISTTIVLYEDVKDLRMVYFMRIHKDLSVIKRWRRVRGFYDPQSNEVHAVEGDEKTLGHEMRHVLGEQHEVGGDFK